MRRVEWSGCQMIVNRSGLTKVELFEGSLLAVNAV